MGKPIRNACLGTLKRDSVSIVYREQIGNIFYLYAGIFEIPKERFIIKTPACWGTESYTPV